MPRARPRAPTRPRRPDPRTATGTLAPADRPRTTPRARAHRASAPPQAPPRFGRRRGRAGLADPRRPAGHRRARPRAERQRRRAVGQGIDPARGQEAAAPRRPGDRPPPAADRHRVGVPRPPRVGRADHGGPPAQGPHPDRGARRRRAGRALREPVQPPVLRRQRLPGQGPERAAVDGGRLRRRRQGPQRGALRRRGQLRRQRAGGPAQADRVGAQGRASRWSCRSPRTRSATRAPG